MWQPRWTKCVREKAVSDTRLWDGGGNGRRILADRALDDRGTHVRSVKVNLGESPLGWLAARGRITNRQLDAGEQLRRDWTVANLGPRSEEHTSELQSLMRISYAVFCLKKKKKQDHKKNTKS